MTRTSTTLLLVLALTSGCAARSKTLDTVATAGAPPPGAPPPLPAGTVAPRWDHYCSVVTGGLSGAPFAALLDQASSSGWEMVAMAVPGGTFVICFKRPHAAAPAAAAPPA